MFNSLRLTISSATKVFSYTALDDHAAIKIGRSHRCEFSVPVEDISREHCLFEIEEDDFFITDLGSSNGVTVDMERIPAHTRVKVTSESLIVLAKIYTLNINPVEVKTKSDTVLRKPDPELKTVSIKLEYPEEKSQKIIPRRRKTKKSSTKEDLEENNSSATSDNTKMVIGFIVILLFVVRHLFYKD